MTSHTQIRMTPAPAIATAAPRVMLRHGVFILVCGIAIGAAGALLLSPYFASYARRGAYRGHQRPTARQIADRMRSQFDLNEEETAKMEAALDRHMQRLAELRKSWEPALDEVYRKFKEEAQAALTPDHYAAWEKDLQNRQARWRASGSQPWPRGDGAASAPSE